MQATVPPSTVSARSNLLPSWPFAEIHSTVDQRSTVLPQELLQVLDTFQKMSTWQSYTSKWKVFVQVCFDLWVSPQSCPVCYVLYFPGERFVLFHDKGLPLCYVSIQVILSNNPISIFWVCGIMCTPRAHLEDCLLSCHNFGKNGFSALCTVIGFPLPHFSCKLDGSPPKCYNFP